MFSQVLSKSEVTSWSTWPCFVDRVEQGEQRIKKKKKKVKKKKVPEEAKDKTTKEIDI